MIDYEKSAKINDCSVQELKVRFDKFPRSQKKIIAICEMCENERLLTFSDYNDLCQSCAAIKSHIDHPNMAIESSERMKGKNNPMKDIKIVKKMVKSIRKYHRMHPEAGKIQSKKLKNSIKHRESINRQRGGRDIVIHHIAYDFKRPDALTIKIARSFHGRIHSPPNMDSRERRYSLID